MIYGVTLGGKHTYRDWGLLPKTRPTIAPPKVRTNYVDVPGLDGALDLSEALTGRVGYQTRDFSAERRRLPKTKFSFSEIYEEEKTAKTFAILYQSTPKKPYIFPSFRFTTTVRP